MNNGRSLFFLKTTGATVKVLLFLCFLTYASPVVAFETNAIWLKGVVHLEERRKLDPRVNIEEFEIRNDQLVTLYVTYRGATRDNNKRAAVSYRLSILKPDGKPYDDLIDPNKVIVGGGGIVTDEHAQDWGISRDAVTLSFSEEDDRGIYIFRIIIKDHVSSEEITRVTKIKLK